MAVIIKGVSADHKSVKELCISMGDRVRNLDDCRKRVKALFDELLTEASWSNHDSRRFKRHYVEGDETLDADIGALEALTASALDIAYSRYRYLELDIDKLFTDSFWKETTKTKAASGS